MDIELLLRKYWNKQQFSAGMKEEAAKVKAKEDADHPGPRVDRLHQAMSASGELCGRGVGDHCFPKILFHGPWPRPP